MLRVECGRWEQTIDELRQGAVEATHPRTRERFMALYEIASGSNATQVAAQSDRHFQSVQAWVHAYNEHGPAALLFRRSGGHPPFVRK